MGLEVQSLKELCVHKNKMVCECFNAVPKKSIQRRVVLKFP